MPTFFALFLGTLSVYNTLKQEESKMKDTIMEAVGAVAAGRNRKFTLRKADGFIYDEGPGFESHPATKSCRRAAYFFVLRLLYNIF